MSTLKLCPTPDSAYDLAGRTMERECRDLGASEAARRFTPVRIVGGWCSPLFSDLVLRANTPRREAAGVPRA
jgi:hypothetical protein